MWQVLCVGGYFGLACYHLAQRVPLRIPLLGSMLFVGLNAVKLVPLVRERFVVLEGEELQLYDAHFSAALTPAQWRRLFDMGTMETATQRQVLVRKGKQVPGLPPLCWRSVSPTSTSDPCAAGRPLAGGVW